MNLTLKDRVLILKSVLPPYDNRRGIELKQSIQDKINLTPEEEHKVELTTAGYGQYEISFKTEQAISVEMEFNFTDKELEYLKEKVDFLDKEGRFSDYTLQTYTKICDEPFIERIKE